MASKLPPWLSPALSRSSIPQLQLSGSANRRIIIVSSYSRRPALNARQFSSTRNLDARRKLTQLKRDFYAWLNSSGQNFRLPLPGHPNYLTSYEGSSGKHLTFGMSGDGKRADEDAEDDAQRPEANRRGVPPSRPFPANNAYRSEAVLSEELREAIHGMVKVKGISVRDTSALMKVSMERVGAVVRLMEIQRQWEKEGKELATPYAEAVLSMVPQTPLNPRRPVPHESISDLPVHAATTQQIFHPVSESKHFTREDAARVFDPKLLPADKRIPHPELIVKEKMRLEGWSSDEKDRYWKEQERKELQAQEKEKKRKATEDARTSVIKGYRWDFRVKAVEVTAESVGKTGRAPTGLGWRYGFPHEDRKRAQVKIPTRVD